LKATVEREPAFNLPWQVAVLTVVLIGAHALRVALGVSPDAFALTRSDLAAGAIAPLFTYIFVHGSWPHVLINSLFCVAFGAPVARWLGNGARGGAAFFAFFIVCGVIAGLGYGGWVDLTVVFGRAPSGWALVGASGAASGLMGAAARLIEGRGRLGSIVGRRVVGIGAAWALANAVLGVFGLTPGTGGAPVAWEAHIIGFFAGVLLIRITGRMAGVRPDHSIAS
jgi:membrane associated rhomboid family serine protease